MMILLVAVIGLVVATALALWPEPGDRRVASADPVPNSPYPRDAEGAAPKRGGRPSSLEGVLVEQLINGDITRRQYTRAVELVAARDEQRHPLSVPRDDHPGACA